MASADTTAWDANENSSADAEFGFGGLRMQEGRPISMEAWGAPGEVQLDGQQRFQPAESSGTGGAVSGSVSGPGAGLGMSMGLRSISLSDSLGLQDFDASSILQSSAGASMGADGGSMSSISMGCSLASVGGSSIGAAEGPDVLVQLIGEPDRSLAFPSVPALLSHYQRFNFGGAEITGWGAGALDRLDLPQGAEPVPSKLETSAAHARLGPLLLRPAPRYSHPVPTSSAKDGSVSRGAGVGGASQGSARLDVGTTTGAAPDYVDLIGGKAAVDFSAPPPMRG